jgi:hypothetical protein
MCSHGRHGARQVRDRDPVDGRSGGTCAAGRHRRGRHPWRIREGAARQDSEPGSVGTGVAGRRLSTPRTERGGNASRTAILAIMLAREKYHLDVYQSEEHVGRRLRGPAAIELSPSVDASRSPLALPLADFAHRTTGGRHAAAQGKRSGQGEGGRGPVVGSGAFEGSPSDPGSRRVAARIRRS